MKNCSCHSRNFLVMTKTNKNKHYFYPKKIFLIIFSPLFPIHWLNSLILIFNHIYMYIIA